MKFTGQYSLLAMMAGAAISLTSNDASAQTVNVDVDVDVLNTVTVTKVADLHFGEIAAVADAAKTASLNLSSSGVATTSSTGTPAYIATIDATNRKVAQVTLEDAADGATLNITIGGVA